MFSYRCIKKPILKQLRQGWRELRPLIAGSEKQMGGTHGHGKEKSKAPQRKWILYIYFLIEVQGCLKSNFVVKPLAKKLLLSFDLNGWNAIYCRAVTKGRGPGIFPGFYKSEPRLLWYKTKILEREKCIKLQNYELNNKPIVY